MDDLKITDRQGAPFRIFGSGGGRTSYAAVIAAGQAAQGDETSGMDRVGLMADDLRAIRDWCDGRLAEVEPQGRDPHAKALHDLADSMTGTVELAGVSIEELVDTIRDTTRWLTSEAFDRGLDIGRRLGPPAL